MIAQAKADDGRMIALPDDSGLFVGIVCGPGGVLYVAAAPTRARLFNSVAKWAVEEARVKLRGQARVDVESLQSRGMDEGAVRTYLKHVTSRWETERLTIQPLDLVVSEAELPT